MTLPTLLLSPRVAFLILHPQPLHTPPILSPDPHTHGPSMCRLRYAEMIPTIRAVEVRSRYKSLTKGMFCLSKFRFRLSVVHKHRPEEVRGPPFLQAPTPPRHPSPSPRRLSGCCCHVPPR